MNITQRLAVVFLFAFSTTLHAQTEWTEFRGKNGVGFLGDTKLPDKIDADSVAWKVPLPGKAWSSPVVWQNKIWLTNATEDGKTMSAVCVDAQSGKVLHDIVMLENEEPAFCHPVNSYASCTPTIWEGKVYLHFGSYGTICLDAMTAKEVWRRTDLPCDHFRGPGTSPVIHNGKVLLAFDGFDQQYVTALDANTGKSQWRTDREINYGTDNGDFKKAYGTVSVFEVGGEELMVSSAAIATIAYRPDTGKPVWTFYTQGMNSSARPQMTSGGVLIISNGMGLLYGVKPEGTGDISKTHQVWKLSKGVPTKSTPVLVGDMMFMCNEKGVVSCVDAETGESHWQQRLGKEFTTSPLATKDNVYFFDTEGNIFVVNASNQYKLVSQSKLGDGFMATPAVVGGMMYLRSKSELFAIRNQGGPEAAQKQARE